MNTIIHFVTAFGCFSLSYLVFDTQAGLPYVALGFLLIGMGCVFVATTIGSLFDDFGGN